MGAEMIRVGVRVSLGVHGRVIALITGGYVSC